MDYQITIQEEPKNCGHRMSIAGLPHLFRGDSEEYSGDHEELLQQYHYDPETPPFWAAGLAETRCYTLPCAVWLAIYDLAQVHKGIRDGDLFHLAHDGETYTVRVDNAWPTCEAAASLEKAFRAEHGISRSPRGEH